MVAMSNKMVALQFQPLIHIFDMVDLVISISSLMIDIIGSVYRQFEKENIMLGYH